jgi:hypothetical protein
MSIHSVSFNDYFLPLGVCERDGRLERVLVLDEVLLRLLRGGDRLLDRLLLLDRVFVAVPLLLRDLERVGVEVTLSVCMCEAIYCRLDDDGLAELV